MLTFGCRVNQADSLACERQLCQAGGVEAPPDTAELIVVNTCSVTAAADQAARQAVRRVARSNPHARIVATGCYAESQPAEVAALPGVTCLVPNAEKTRLTETLGRRLEPAASAAPRPRVVPGPGHHGRTVHPLLVQTGCDETCTYCTIPSTRGASRSRPPADVLAEADELAAAGYHEAVLTGVHLGAYGRDLAPPSSLQDLVGALDRLPGRLSFRLSSLEPMDCTPAVVHIAASSTRFAPHFHLPLQHASDRVLGAMRRPYTLADFDAIVVSIRAALPDAAIGTDVIVGFPGEADEDFDQLARYLLGSCLTHVHVFPYSDRPGTQASRLPSKVNAGVVRERCEALRAVGRRLNAAFVAAQVGRTRAGLTTEDGTLVVTDNYLKVRIPPGHARNERVRVLLRSACPLEGEVVA